MTNKEKLANYEMMKNECFETRKLNDSLGKLVVVKNKEIKELEQENKVLAQNLEDTEIVNKSLEKENAELKGLVNQYKASKCGSISLVNRNMIMFDQLTKAKELLNEFLDFESSCMERGIYISDKIRTEAEQFLSEVEK